MSSNNLTRLKEELAELYPTENDIRDVLQEAGLAVQHINLQGKGVVIWSDALNEAEKHAKTADIIEVVLRRYPRNAKLRALLPLFKPQETLVSRKELSTPELTQAWPSNPFTDTLRVTEARFVGRGASLRRLHGTLETGSLHLQGKSKIGKSSLLYLIYQQQVKSSMPAIFADFQHQTMDDVMTEVAELLGVPPSTRWTDLSRAISKQPFYLFLDEFDYAPQMGFTEEWGRRFRWLATSGFRLITSARHEPKEIYPSNNIASDWYNFLSPETLGPLTAAEAEQLLTSRLPSPLSAQIFTPEVRQQLITLSARHPFKLTRAAYRYYDQQTNDPDSDWQSLYQQDLHHFGLE